MVRVCSSQRVVRSRQLAIFGIRVAEGHHVLDGLQVIGQLNEEVHTGNTHGPDGIVLRIHAAEDLIEPTGAAQR
ncbi:hypothetical protein D3C81_1967500 [compost metagenome]